MPLTPPDDAFLASWLRKQEKPVQRRNLTFPCNEENQPVEPLTPQKEPVEPPTADPSFNGQKEPVEPPTPDPSFNMQKEPVEPLTPNPSSNNQRGDSPKWKDDEWFEKKYGDPNYYKRNQRS
jgi:hypothetical protein